MSTGKLGADHKPLSNVKTKEMIDPSFLYTIAVCMETVGHLSVDETTTLSENASADLSVSACQRPLGSGQVGDPDLQLP